VTDPCNVDISNGEGSGPVKDPRWNNITSHFEECGVNELVLNHLLSSYSALLTRLNASSTVDPMQ